MRLTDEKDGYDDKNTATRGVIKMITKIKMIYTFPADSAKIVPPDPTVYSFSSMVFIYQLTSIFQDSNSVGRYIEDFTLTSTERWFRK